MSAAEWADQTLLTAVGAYRLAYVFISRRRPAEAAELAMGAASALERRMRPGTPEELSVYGGLHLAAATAAAAEFDRAAVPRFLRQARRAATRLGGDHNLHGTAFGPTNVAIHTISTAVAIGDARTAVEAGRTCRWARCLRVWSAAGPRSVWTWPAPTPSADRTPQRSTPCWTPNGSPPNSSATTPAPPGC